MDSQGKHCGRSKSTRSRRSEAGDMFLKEAMQRSISSKHSEEATVRSKKISELKTCVRTKKTESLPQPSSTKQEEEDRRSNSLHSRFPTPAYLLAYKDLKDEEKQIRYQRKQRLLEQGKKQTQERSMSLNDYVQAREQELERKPVDDDASTVQDMFDMFNWSRSSSYNTVKMPKIADGFDDEHQKESQVRRRRLRSSQKTHEHRSKSVHSLKSTHTCSTRSCSLSKCTHTTQRSKSTRVARLYSIGPPRTKELKVPAAA